MTPQPPAPHDVAENRRPHLVAVSWARTAPVELLAPSLTADDRARLGDLRRNGDRDRSASARVLLRAAVGARRNRTGGDPSQDVPDLACSGVAERTATVDSSAAFAATAKASSA